MQKVFFFILFQLAVTEILLAQQFGGNPPSVKWRQLNTDSARVIYPVGLDSQAQRIAGIVHYLAKQKPFSPGDKIYKIDIVLQNQTTVANGYVGLGPYRSEFLLTPDPNSFDQGSLPWADQLAAHEYRHVMQYNNFRNGVSKALYYLFGQEGLVLGLDAFVPDWFFEGDAVYNETYFTNQGRGRLPFFLNAYPALWKSDKHYSFMKLRNGSLKDYVPNHYNLGYLLVNYGREKYGIDFWNKVTHDASAYKGLVYPFQQAVKRYAGISYKSFYNDAFAFYKKQWNVEADKQEENFITKSTKNYVTNYLFPYQVGEDSLLYLKSSYRQIPVFMIKDRNGEHKLRVKDISGDAQFSYRNGKIVYAAYETDARWAWKDYSVIKLLDIKTGEQKSITHKSKYFTPDISENGLSIAAVQNAEDGKSAIHIINAVSGDVIKSIKSSGVSVFTDPKFIDDTSLVTAVRLTDGMMALAIVDLNTGSVERLTPPTFNVVGYPCVNNGFVYFTASYSGNDDVFALQLKDKKIFRITNDKLGNYYINVHNGKAIASHFTADGYQLKEIVVTDILSKGTEIVNVSATAGNYLGVATDSGHAVSLSATPARFFPSTKYNKATRLFNFHSWRPYYEDPDFTFSLYGENVLNTFTTELFYHYNQDEKTNGVGFNAAYGALFPYINFGTEYTFDRVSALDSQIRKWSQLDTRIGLNVPLNFSKGKTYKLLNIGTNIGLRNEFIQGASKANFENINFTYLHHFISWQQNIQSARQHIYPRLGYSFSLNHRYAIGNYSGYQFAGRGTVYLPGLYSTHSLILSAAIQQRDTSRVFFGSSFANARGYPDYYRTTIGSRMWRLSANYHLPLFIPDWGFGSILYIQRIRTNLFYDYQRLFSNDKNLHADLRSTGIELYADTRWWNQYALTFGIRYSRLLDRDISGIAGANVIELILPVSIIPR